MKDVVMYAVKTINAGGLMEEIRAALPDRVEGILWAGFTASGHLFEPIPETRVIATRTVGGTETQETADPGELRFRVPDDFSTAEETTLAGLLDTHDYTVQTEDQLRLVQDADDVAELRTKWDGGPVALTADEIHKMLRLLLRKYGEGI